jgi:hypothetical protein
MSEPVAAAAVVGTFFKAIAAYLPGAAGAAISLKFLGGDLSPSQRLFSFAIGFACAIYVAPAMIDYFDIPGARVHSGIEFLVGLFALATCRELFNEFNNGGLIATIKRRYFGSDK